MTEKGEREFIFSRLSRLASLSDKKNVNTNKKIIMTQLQLKTPHKEKMKVENLIPISTIVTIHNSTRPKIVMVRIPWQFLIFTAIESSQTSLLTFVLAVLLSMDCLNPLHLWFFPGNDLLLTSYLQHSHAVVKKTDSFCKYWISFLKIPCKCWSIVMYYFAKHS